jgi:hypothetical protein
MAMRVSGGVSSFVSGRCVTSLVSGGVDGADGFCPTILVLMTRGGLPGEIRLGGTSSWTGSVQRRSRSTTGCSVFCWEGHAHGQLRGT